MLANSLGPSGWVARGPRGGGKPRRWAAIDFGLPSGGSPPRNGQRHGDPFEKCGLAMPREHPQATPLTPSEIRLIVIGAMLTLFLSALDQTVVATALPPIARDLGNFALISWVITSYLLTSTCATPIVGKLSDLYGRRLVLRICLLAFIVGSALCALAPGMLALILARALQGLGGGGLITLAQTIVADVVTPRERGRYAAYFSV